MPHAPMTVPAFKDHKATQLPVLEMGCPDRYLTPKESLKVWDMVFGAGSLEPHQLRGYRTVVVWRVTRAIAFHKGALHLDQRLSDLGPEDWATPRTEGANPPTAHTGTDVTRWGVQDLIARRGGLALLPRPDTKDRHAALVAHLAESMHLQRGSKDYPHLGHYGLHGLTHKHTIMDYWPEQHELLAFEDKVVDQIQGLVLKWSRRRIQTHLRDMFDLTAKEIGGLIALAVEEAKEAASQDIETTRAIMVGKVEDYVDRMRESADSANEMKGLKVLCAIHGLHKTDPEQTAEILIGVVAKVASDETSANSTALRIEACPLEDEDEERQEMS